jgi:hypothetical protein
MEVRLPPPKIAWMTLMWRFSRNSTGELRQHPLGTSGMKRLALKQVAKWWITNLAWSEWSLVDELTSASPLPNRRVCHT